MNPIVAAFGLNGEVFAVRADGTVFNLSRHAGMPDGKLEWQALPPVPEDREAALQIAEINRIEAAARAAKAEATGPSAPIPPRDSDEC
jgi:hypothetical protein